LSLTFSDLDETSAKNFDQAIAYLRKKYESYFSGFRLYVFVTCAVDKQNCLNVFEAVQDTIVSNAMHKQRYGL